MCAGEPTAEGLRWLEDHGYVSVEQGEKHVQRLISWNGWEASSRCWSLGEGLDEFPLVFWRPLLRQWVVLSSRCHCGVNLAEQMTMALQDAYAGALRQVSKATRDERELREQAKTLGVVLFEEGVS